MRPDNFPYSMLMIMGLGERAAARREQLGLTQQQIADHCHVKQPSIAALEAGETQRPRFLDELAEILKTTKHWLKTGEEDHEAGGEEPATVDLDGAMAVVAAIMQVSIDYPNYVTEDPAFFMKVAGEVVSAYKQREIPFTVDAYQNSLTLSYEAIRDNYTITPSDEEVAHEVKRVVRYWELDAARRTRT
jgi:transcriptional regulator with XRE-family HTH domain